MTAPISRERVREWLDDGTEVTNVSDRALILRAVNSTLRAEYAVGKLTAEVAGCRADIQKVYSRVAGSIPDLAEAAGRMADVAEELTGPGKKTDSDRVREVLRQEEEDKELKRWRNRVKWGADVFKQGTGVLAGAGLVELAHLLHWL